MKTKDEIKAMINDEIKAIRDLAIDAQDNINLTPTVLDSIARQIGSHADVVKDLAFELSRPQVAK